MKKIFYVLLFFSSLIFSQDEFEFYLKGSSVTDICSDGNNIWVTTNGSGIFKYNPTRNHWEQYSTSQGNLQHDFFYCITANEDWTFHL